MTSRKVVEFINKEFGENIATISKAKSLYDEILTRKLEIESNLNFASSEVPGKLESAVKDAEACGGRIEAFSGEYQELNGDIANHNADVAEVNKRLASVTSQIHWLKSYSSYLECINKIEDLSSDIQTAIVTNSMDLASQRFASMGSLVQRLLSSDCEHLVRFATDTLVYWHKVLKEKLSSEFEAVLNAWRWPFIVSTNKPAKSMANAEECKKKLPKVFASLLAIQQPSEIELKHQSKNPILSNIQDWKPIPLPIQIMLKPLKVRFRFHFYGNKQTNSLDKPEWYMTQILTWIRDHRDFLNTKIQPLVDKESLSVDVLNEFARGLVLLVVEKMTNDLPEIVYDDQIFCHFIDEVLAFHKELVSQYEFMYAQNMVLGVLTQEESFHKWLKLEKKFAIEKMDVMMSSNTAWESQYQNIAEVDDQRLPECTEAFITLMLSITDRYKPLPSLQHRVKFVDLQLELLEDYRLRIVQVKNASTDTPLSVDYVAILNTVNYIVEVLKQWTELPFFMELHLYKIKYEDRQCKEIIDENKIGDGDHGDVATGENQGQNNVEMETDISPTDSVNPVSLAENDIDFLEGTLFDSMINLYEHLKSEMLNNVLKYIVDDVKARSKPYRKDKWLTLPSQKDLVSLALSASACEMLMVLKDLLQQMSLLLSKDLFTTCWQRVAHDLNLFIYKEVILGNHFNDGGSAQLQFDMVRNLFPLFGQCTQKPENYFKDVKESCILLTLKPGSAMLLKEVLYQALHEPHVDKNMKLTDPVAALHDIGVFKLTLDEAELILSLRASLGS